jgi:ABC-type transport system involved in cytochrome c biogenesis ATPase subunit
MLQLEFVNFQSKNETQEQINLLINKAQKYSLPSSTFNQNDIMLACSGLNENYNGQILLNNQNIKHCKYAKHYLQKHTLFITDNACYLPTLTVKQNVQIFSYYWNKRDISESAICGIGLQEVVNEKAQNLTEEQKTLLSLSRLLACPSHMWIIKKEALYTKNQEQLSEKSQQILDNIFTIRTKQNGAILVLEGVES